MEFALAPTTGPIQDRDECFQVYIDFRRSKPGDSVLGRKLEDVALRENERKV